MIMRTMYLAACHTVSYAAVRSTNSAPAFLAKKNILNALRQQRDLIYSRPPVLKTRLFLRVKFIN